MLSTIIYVIFSVILGVIATALFFLLGSIVGMTIDYMVNIVKIC